MLGSSVLEMITNSPALKRAGSETFNKSWVEEAKASSQVRSQASQHVCWSQKDDVLW